MSVTTYLFIFALIYEIENSVNVHQDITGASIIIDHINAQTKLSEALLDNKECKKTFKGVNYMGTKSQTTHGDQCQMWSSQHPNRHGIGRYDHDFPENNVTLAKNYCRNVGKRKYGPWCYTTTPGRRRGYCSIPLCSEHAECKRDRQGKKYMGKISQTVNGQICLPWTLFANKYNDIDFPDTNIAEAYNYCRNPNKYPDDNGPWCIYTDNEGYNRTLNCDIPYCSSMMINHTECKTTVKGIDYTGTTSETIHGDQCQMWSSQYPNRHSVGIYNHEFPENNVTLAKNYCRNLNNNKLGPWCYTMNPDRRAEYCLIPMCSEPTKGTYPECMNDRRGIEYRGKINVTMSGNRCLPWNSKNKYKDADLPDNNTHEALNYCRNPDNKKLGPLCYTENIMNPNKSTISHCGIPICGIPSEMNEVYIKRKFKTVVKTMLWDTANVLIAGVFPGLMLLGLVSNTLCIAVFTRPSLIESTTAFLLITLAIVDFLSLIMGAFPKWLQKISGLYMDAYNDITCKVYTYLYCVVMTSPGWIILVVTFEQYMAIAKPHKVKDMCTKMKTGLSLLVISTCLFLLNIPVLFDVRFSSIIIFERNEISFLCTCSMWTF